MLAFFWLVLSSQIALLIFTADYITPLHNNNNNQFVLFVTCSLTTRVPHVLCSAHKSIAVLLCCMIQKRNGYV